MIEIHKNNLFKKSREIRLSVLENIYKSKHGHIGGTYSAIDIFVYLYYGEYGLKYYTDGSLYEDRDRLVVGKGHSCLALYNIWIDKGIIDADLINDYGANGYHLGGQLNINTSGVECNSGSLGHAIGIASGMAIAGRIDNKKYFSIAFVGDGECSEGSIWESIDFAGQQKLNNLLCIVDYNRLGATDFVEHVGNIDSLVKRVETYNWDCKYFDGHDFEEIELVLKNRFYLDKPMMLIANTIKGKGISFMENGIKWHHSVPSEDEYITAKRELEI